MDDSVAWLGLSTNVALLLLIALAYKLSAKSSWLMALQMLFLRRNNLFKVAYAKIELINCSTVKSRWIEKAFYQGVYFLQSLVQFDNYVHIYLGGNSCKQFWFVSLFLMQTMAIFQGQGLKTPFGPMPETAHMHRSRRYIWNAPSQSSTDCNKSNTICWIMDNKDTKSLVWGPCL